MPPGRRASRRSRLGQQRSGTISESVRLVRGADGGTIAMRIEYLAAIAIAAVAAGTGLAVHSVGSLPPEKQSTPAAAQLATLLAESVDPFLLRWLTVAPQTIARRKARATILSASSGKERCNAFASHPMALASIRPFLVCRIERENSSAASAYAATSRPVLPILALFGPDRRG